MARRDREPDEPDHGVVEGASHRLVVRPGTPRTSPTAGFPDPQANSAEGYPPIRPTRMLVTITDVMVTVEKPATIIFGRI